MRLLDPTTVFCKPHPEGGLLSFKCILHAPAAAYPSSTGEGISDPGLDVCIEYAYTQSVEIVWDPQKARSNLNKHGIRFSDAEVVFYDPLALTREDTDTRGGQRFVTGGAGAFDRMLVVVYTYRGGNIRLISACPATKKERGEHEKGI